MDRSDLVTRTVGSLRQHLVPNILHVASDLRYEMVIERPERRRYTEMEGLERGVGKSPESR